MFVASDQDAVELATGAEVARRDAAGAGARPLRARRQSAAVGSTLGDGRQTAV